MPHPHLARRVAMVMALAILACLVALALALAAVRDRIDDQAAAGSVRLMAARLHDRQEALAASTHDYAHWDEAYDRTAAGDLAWLADNYGYAATDGTIFDGTILYGGPLDAPLAWVAGGPREPGPSFLPPDLLDRIAAAVRRTPFGSWATIDTFIAPDGRLVLLSATRLMPYNKERVAGLQEADLPVVVMTSNFEEADVGATVEALSLEGLTFARVPAPGLTRLTLHGPDGRVLGALAWEPPRPGSVLLGAMAPVLGLGAAAFLLLGAVATGLARALVRRLVAGEAEARRLCRTDPLTGLPNRLAFTEHLGQAETAGAAAVLFIDLNGFKSINDSIGHAGGDAVVAGLARRLAPLAGPGVFLARVGGDEFVAVLSGGERGADEVAERAHALAWQAREAVAEPFAVMDREVRVSLAQGLALRRGPDVPLSELVRRADLAMYRAKRDRTGAAQVHEPGPAEAGGPGRAPVEAPGAGASQSEAGPARRLARG